MRIHIKKALILIFALIISPLLFAVTPPGVIRLSNASGQPLRCQMQVFDNTHMQHLETPVTNLSSIGINGSVDLNIAGLNFGNGGLVLITCIEVSVPGQPYSNASINRTDLFWSNNPPGPNMGSQINILGLAQCGRMVLGYIWNSLGQNHASLNLYFMSGPFYDN